MTNEVFRDKRLLGALDYIDERFIAEVTESYTFEAPGEYKRDKKTVFRAYRQFAALAACLLLLSAAIPVLNYAVQRFGTGTWDGNAGAGSATQDISNDIIDFSELTEDITGKYYNYVLTEEDYNELNNAWYKQYNKYFADSLEECNYWLSLGDNHFYGKYGEALVIMLVPMLDGGRFYDVGDYRFFTDNVIIVVYNQTEYSLDEAADMNIFSEEDIMYLAKYHTELYGENAVRRID